MSSGKIFVPPFKIQGIKTKLVPLIKSSVRFHDGMTWIEPFMGSAVVGLNVAPKNAIFADLNPHIINFYNRVKDGTITSGRVREFLEEQGALLAKKDGEHYYRIRDRFNGEHDPLDFLFLNRSCFNGMIRFNRNGAYNVPYGHKPKRFAKAYVTKIVNQVGYFEEMVRDNNWIFLCQSFEDTVATADGNSFIYCDPPYIGRHVDYFDSWDEGCEMRLKSCLLSSGAKFMLSTWDFNRYRSNLFIDSVWGGLNKITHEHFYFVGARETNRNAMTEALLVNYQLETKPMKREYGVRQLQFAFG
jgi:DNA adenine methylase